MTDMKISATALRKLQRNNAHVADYLDAYRRMGCVEFPRGIAGELKSMMAFAVCDIYPKRDE